MSDRRRNPPFLNSLGGMRGRQGPRCLKVESISPSPDCGFEQRCARLGRTIIRFQAMEPCAFSWLYSAPRRPGRGGPLTTFLIAALEVLVALEPQGITETLAHWRPSPYVRAGITRKVLSAVGVMR